MTNEKTVIINNAMIFEMGRDYNMPRIVLANPTANYDMIDLSQVVAESIQLEPSKHYVANIEVKVTYSEPFSPENFINKSRAFTSSDELKGEVLATEEAVING